MLGGTGAQSQHLAAGCHQVKVRPALKQPVRHLGRGLDQVLAVIQEQEDLAARVSCSVSTIKNWEAGRAVPGADDLARLAVTLGVKVDQLYEGGKR